MERFDHIVVGAGSAGCVLAARLSEDPSTRVLLLEAGPPDRSLWLTMPSAFYKPVTGRRYNWAYVSEPEPALGGRRVEVPRGRVLGGSSSINAMVFVRGNPGDYDGWARDQACAHWSYAHCLPYFRRLETRDAGPDAYRGGDGPIGVITRRGAHVLHQAWLQAGAQSPFGRSPDLNGARQEGLGVLDASIRGGCRSSAAREYLHPAMGRPNLVVRTGVFVTRVLLEGRRATGVEYLAGGRPVQVRAAREVVVSGGAVNSPQLLMLSGLGPADALRALGIAVVADLQGVGANLQDHLGCNMRYACREPVTLLPALSPLGKARLGLRWLLARDGLGASNHYETGGFVRTNPAVPYPNFQYHFIPLAVEYGRIGAQPVHGYQARITQGLPASRGSLRLRSADPRDPPLIRFDYLHEESDRRDFRDAIRMTRELFARPAFDRWRGAELLPGAQVSTDAGIDAYLAETARTDHHISCTCKMGSDAMAVVDGDLRVHGVENLRVADASVMPRIVNGNLNATALMIGEKAADLVSGRKPLAPSYAGTGGR